MRHMMPTYRRQASKERVNESPGRGLAVPGPNGSHLTKRREQGKRKYHP
jgi:hypothetical protein